MREKTLNKAVGPADQRAFLPGLNAGASRAKLVSLPEALTTQELIDTVLESQAEQEGV